MALIIGKCKISVKWSSDCVIKNEAGKPIVIIGGVIDISERKRATLLKDEFIGMISHEIKTPLTIVIGAISTAMSEGVSPEDARRYYRTRLQALISWMT